MTAYCTTAEVKEYGGTYLSRSVPTTLSLDWDRMITDVCNEIDGWLSEVGVIIPIAATYTTALARLKELACIGVLAKSEEAIAFTSNPMSGNIARGENYKERYEQLLGIPKEYDKNNNPIYRGYLYSPRRRLFAGDSDVADAFNNEEAIRPVGSVVWISSEENSDLVALGFDYEF